MFNSQFLRNKNICTPLIDFCVFAPSSVYLLLFPFLTGQTMHTLDEYDKKLLRLLQQNNLQTTEQLSKEVNLSQSAVQRRITKLRNEKIIEADVSIISPAASGVGITCIVDVALHEGSLRNLESFKSSMMNCPEVAQCYYVTGSHDFVLVVNTRDMAHYDAFSKKNLIENPNMKHFYTHVVIDKVKVGYGIPI